MTSARQRLAEQIAIGAQNVQVITREEWLCAILVQAHNHWDSMHADGWNEQYMESVPSVWNEMARAVCEALTINPHEQMHRRGTHA